MKTLVNKNNPEFRIIAPEIGTGTHGYYYVGNVGYHKDKWTLVEEEPTCKESLQVEEEHPDNFTSFEWLIGRLMFRGCDLWGMTDGEDDNGVVTKLIKDRAAEMMELLERKLDPMAEPVDLEKAAEEWCKKNNKGIALSKDKKSHYLTEGIEAFKAGAEWQKKQMCKDCPNRGNTHAYLQGLENGKQQFCERNYIKGFNAAIERIEVELQAMRKKEKQK